MPAIGKREAAKRDLVQEFIYFAENASLDVSDRFLSRVESTFADPAQQPMTGASPKFKHCVLTNICKWQVKAVDNHQIFYELDLMGCASCACSGQNAPG